MKVLHLSHIDLDGYGAQYVAKHFFDDITFFNANYGKEIMVRLEEMFKILTRDKTLFLITDLNLTLQESELTILLKSLSHCSLALSRRG